MFVFIFFGILYVFINVLVFVFNVGEDYVDFDYEFKFYGYLNFFFGCVGSI